MKCIFVYNPVSGSGTIAKKLTKIEKSLRETYDEVIIAPTQAQGDTTRFARDAVGVYDTIVFAGGDGTFNEVLQGVADAENPPNLGYIPCGTVNDIAHTLKIPKNVNKALKIIKDGRCEKLDCMKVNDRYAMYFVGAGTFTNVSYATPQDEKNKHGKIAYFIEGVKDVSLESFKLTCKGKRKKLNANSIFISFMNSKYVSGFKINEHESLQDGEIEVAIVHPKQKKSFWRKIVSLFSLAWLFVGGLKRKNEHLVHLRGSQFDVDVDPNVVWAIDGEKGCNGKIHLEVLPKKIPVIIPKKLKRI